MKFSQLATTTFLLLALILPSAAIPVVNNGFEDGNFTGWTQFGNTEATGVTSGGGPSEGAFLAAFGPVGSVGGISQNLTTTLGNTYQILFDLASTGGGPNSFDTTFGGTPGQSFTNSAAFGFTTYSYSAVAAAVSTPLTFTFRHDPSFWYLDNVIVNDLGPAAVPEINPNAAALPLAVIVFGLLALSDRRRALA